MVGGGILLRRADDGILQSKLTGQQSEGISKYGKHGIMLYISLSFSFSLSLSHYIYMCGGV